MYVLAIFSIVLKDIYLYSYCSERTRTVGMVKEHTVAPFNPFRIRIFRLAAMSRR